MTRVAVLGATGRIGSLVASAVDAAEDLDLVAALDRRGLTGLAGVLADRRPDVAVDVTHPDAVMEHVRACVAAGVHAVVGTSGFDRARLDEVRRVVEGAEAHVMVVPNFALGAVLMQRFAAEAARRMATAEIIELHHDGKVDAPSGTAIETAHRIAEARGGASTTPTTADGSGRTPARGALVDGVPIHSVRGPGLVAHQEVILGAPGETLTIRHDALDRTAFVPGVLLAIRRIADLPGLTVGLDALLDAR